MKFIFLTFTAALLVSCASSQSWPTDKDVERMIAPPTKIEHLTASQWMRLSDHEKILMVNLAAARQQKLNLPPELLKALLKSDPTSEIAILNYKMSQGDPEAETLLRSHFSRPTIRLDTLCWDAGFIKDRSITQGFIDRISAGDFGGGETPPELNFYEPIWNHLYRDGMTPALSSDL